MTCKECKFFQNIQNTNTGGKGFCVYNGDFQLINVDDECFYYKPVKLTCKDCARFRSDYGCFTDDNPADNCCGFRDKDERDFYNFIFKQALQGQIAEDIYKMVDEFYENYEAPAQVKDN